MVKVAFTVLAIGLAAYFIQVLPLGNGRNQAPLVLASGTESASADAPTTPSAENVAEEEPATEDDQDQSNEAASIAEPRIFVSCIPGLSGSRQTSDGRVECGCEYSGSATSVDGHWVCAGGLYSGSATSVDGSDVACGGLYSGSATSVDGHRVCAGGRYSGSATSVDGANVACGGLYSGSATSVDGHRVCAGGQYTGSATSVDGTDVACGGLYSGSATSVDGRKTCYGGLY